MKIIEVTPSNIDKYAHCSLQACIAYRKSGLTLDDNERKEWIFNHIFDNINK